MILLDFPTLVQRFAAQARAAASTTLDFTVGSVLRALSEANGALALWLQWLILQVLQATRAATSQGNDLDTFVADYGLTRLPAIGAVGFVTFARASATLPALVPIGTLVKSLDGTQSFAVTLDPMNPAYVAASGGYVLYAGLQSLTVPAQGLATGSATNAQAGTVTTLATAIPGVNTVTNGLAFTGGIDPESDDALRVRFALFNQGRSKATHAAVASAIAGVQQGLSFSIAESVDTTGAVRPGNFVVTVDDGSGAPSAALLAQVSLAVEAVRPIGVMFAVQGPIVQGVAVSMIITAASGYAKANLQGPVATAVTALINSLGIGTPLLYGQVYRTAYDAVAGVGTVTNLTLNGGQADIPAVAPTIIKPSTVAVN